MSRIGNKPIVIPGNTTLQIGKDNAVSVKGPKGELTRTISPNIALKLEGNTLSINNSSEQKSDKSLHGLSRALLNNMIVGVTEGFQKQLQIVGTGYKANVEGDILELNLGKSHVIYIKLPPEITLAVAIQKGKMPSVMLTVSGIDKELVGLVSAKIREQKPPEPYITKRNNTQKGIRCIGEILVGKMKKDGK